MCSAAAVLITTICEIRGDRQTHPPDKDTSGDEDTYMPSQGSRALWGPRYVGLSTRRFEGLWHDDLPGWGGARVPEDEPSTQGFVYSFRKALLAKKLFP